MPSETHRLLLTARQATLQGLVDGDPDGPLQPMLPAAMWRDGGARRAERICREARDAALIAALRFT